MQAVLLLTLLSSSLSCVSAVAAKQAKVERPSHRTGIAGLFRHGQRFQRSHFGGLSDTARHVYSNTASMESAADPVTVEESTQIKVSFACFVILAAALCYMAWTVEKKTVQYDGEATEASSSSQDFAAIHPWYKVGVLAAVIGMTMMLFFVVVGIVGIQNKSIITEGAKKDIPGYEGQEVHRERAGNYGERALYASAGLLVQGFAGAMLVMLARKYLNVQMDTNLLGRFALRGAGAAAVTTMLVEFVHLPFHDFLSGEPDLAPRVFVVLSVVAFIAVVEEAAKIGVLSYGLLRERPTQPLEIHQQYVDSPLKVVLGGIAAGFGFAFIENIPRILALATEPPLSVESSSGYYGSSSSSALLTEGDQRAVRTMAFLYWIVLNIQPVLAGIASIRYAIISEKGPLSPQDWFKVLKTAIILHFLFDLLSRSKNASVEFVAMCLVPYSLYIFHQEWTTLRGSDQGQDALLNPETQNAEEPWF